MRSEVKHSLRQVLQSQEADRSITGLRCGFLTGFVHLSGTVHLCAVAAHLLAEFLSDGQRDGGDGSQLFSPGGSVCLRQRLGHPAETVAPLRTLTANLLRVRQHLDHLPVGAIVGS